jgi:hypothetical protein
MSSITEGESSVAPSSPIFSMISTKEHKNNAPNLHKTKPLSISSLINNKKIINTQTMGE